MPSHGVQAQLWRYTGGLAWPQMACVTYSPGTFLNADEMMPGPGKSPIKMISGLDDNGSDAPRTFKKTLKFP